jgi:hypothetical protein
MASDTDATAAPTALAAMATAPHPDQLHAGQRKSGVFLVDDAKRRQGDVGDFFFTQRNFVI